MKKKRLPEHIQQLAELAVEARNHSYSPYSKYAVGAALLTSEGEVFTGCNVENSTYGATTCAEQIAVFKAVSERGALEIQDLVVVTESSPPAACCGICRQVIREFAPAQLKIHFVNLRGEHRSETLGQLFPDAFTPDHLLLKKKRKKPTRQRPRSR